MKRIVVTGANGFIGSALLHSICREDVEVWAVVRNKNSRIEQIQNIPGIHIVYCEMENAAALPDIIGRNDIDICIHLAWEGSFGDARADYALQLKNVECTLDVISSARKLGATRIVGVGSLAEQDAMYLLPDDGVRPAAVSTYGMAKVTAHYMTKIQCAKQGMEYVWCCLSNTYGVGNTTNNFVNMACRKMLRGERAAFTLGEQPYDFVYITDAADALVAAALRGKPNTDYFLGSTEPRQLKDYIYLIRDAIDVRIPLYLGEIPFRGKPLPLGAFDTTKIVLDTGYEPKVPFEKGIKETVAWVRERECRRV